MTEQQKDWQRYETRTIKRGEAQGPEAGQAARETVKFFRDMGHDGRPMSEEMRDIVATLDQGISATQSCVEFWEQKARERVQEAETALRSHEQERDR